MAKQKHEFRCAPTNRDRLHSFIDFRQAEPFLTFRNKLLRRNNKFLLAKQHNIDTTKKTNVFSELEALQMIPVIIKKLRSHKLSGLDTDVLRATYGDLWQLIDKEAKRPAHEDISPILKSLLHAQEAHKSRTAMGNDVGGNTVEKIVRTNHLERIPLRLTKLRLSENLSPAERLLKVAAVLIRESLERKRTTNKLSAKTKKITRRRNHVLKKQLIHRKSSDAEIMADSVSPTNAVRPRRGAKMLRSKRSANKAASMMKSDVEMAKKLNEIMDPIAATEAEDIDYELYDDDVVDVKNQQPKAPANNQKNQAQLMRREQQAKQLSFLQGEDYMDYAFDTTDTDHFNEEEELLSNFYSPKRRSAYEDYDYGSFSDLMHLAAKHTLRSQRENDYFNDEEQSTGDDSKSDDSTYDDYIS